MSDQKISRRTVLKVAAGAVAAPLIVPSSVFGDDAKPAPSERVTLAHIGIGGQGTGLFQQFQHVSDAQSVAVVDCFQSRRERLASLCGGRGYLDFREMLDKEDVDAIVIATPDHWHITSGIVAARKKKHLYIEKPLGLSIEQNLVFEKVAAENKIRFQYGTQQRSQNNCWLGCELVRRGAIGKIHTIEVDAPDGHGGGVRTPAPIPADLGDAGFEMWTGPAPQREYAAERCRPDGTYMIYDYSIGYLGGWGAHPLDIMVWGSDADLSGPIEIQGTGKIDNDALLDAVFGWDVKGKLGDVNFIFKPGSDRTRFIGDGGAWIEVRRGGTSASDPKLLETPLPRESAKLQVSWDRNHYADFIRGIKEGYAPVSTLRDAVRSDNISHLCNIAIRTQSRVVWDPKKRAFIEASDDAKAMTRRAMRAPWTLEG
ncbi:MAG: Gfo/Idh/MocA family protein [Thermoguttaceae bacterium]